MATEYKILERTKKKGIFTVRIEDERLAFNHTLIHPKDYFEEFEPADVDIEIVNNTKMHHINGEIISFEEFRFITNIIRDM